MQCKRCDGLMVADSLIDLQESSIPMKMKGRRCVSCGNIVDPLIQQHRVIQRAGWCGCSEQTRPCHNSVTHSKRRPRSCSTLLKVNVGQASRCRVGAGPTMSTSADPLP